IEYVLGIGTPLSYDKNCWILIHNGIPKNHGYLDTVYTNGWIPKTTNGYHIYTLNTRYPSIPMGTQVPRIPDTLVSGSHPFFYRYTRIHQTPKWIPNPNCDMGYPIPVITMYPQIPHPHHTKYPFYYPPSPSKSPSQTRPLYLGVPNHYTINPVLVPVVVRGGCGLGFVFGYVWDNGSLPVVLGTLSGWGTGFSWVWVWYWVESYGRQHYPTGVVKAPIPGLLLVLVGGGWFGSHHTSVLHIKLPNTRVLGGTGDLIVFGGDLAVFGTLERVLAEGSIGWVLGMVGSSYDWWLIWLWWLVVGTGGGLVGALVLGGMGNYPGLGVLGITFDLDKCTTGWLRAPLQNIPIYSWNFSPVAGSTNESLTGSQIKSSKDPLIRLLLKSFTSLGPQALLLVYLHAIFYYLISDSDRRGLIN
ncbi:hypothetical protein G9A89_000710, partial [Geosiphon pyriformis]